MRSDCGVTRKRVRCEHRRAPLGEEVVLRPRQDAQPCAAVEARRRASDRGARRGARALPTEVDRRPERAAVESTEAAAPTCVARLPSIGGTSMPPSNATYARAPERRSPKRSTLPGRQLSATPVGDLRRRRGVRRDRRRYADRRARRSIDAQLGPTSVTSSAAASASLPTSRFATRCDSASMAPPTGTPQRLMSPAAAVLNRREEPRPDDVIDCAGCPVRSRTRARGIEPASRSLDDAPARTARVARREQCAGSRDGSNDAPAVRPMICQPPGDSRG